MPVPEMGTPIKSTGKALATVRTKPSRAGGDLFIVDNSDDDWKVAHYLREQGFPEAWSLVGGIGAWLETGAPWARPEG